MPKKMLLLYALLCVVPCANGVIATLGTVFQETSPGSFESVQCIKVTNQFAYAPGGITVTWKNDFSINSETINVTLENRNANVTGTTFKAEVRKGANNSYIIRVFKTVLPGNLLTIFSETEATVNDVIVHVEMYGILI